jgi:hypothetical protein
VGDDLFEVASLGVQRFEFLVEDFELFLEILVTHLFAGCDTDVPTRVERPALRFNLREHCDAAQARHVGVFRFSTEHFFKFRARVVAAERVIWFFATIEPDDVRNKADLRRSPVAMSTVNLPVNVSGVDEQDGVFPRCRSFSFVEKPEGARKRNRVNMFGPTASITSTPPSSTSWRRTSCSEERASEAEFAMINPARPFLLSAE